MQRIQKFLADLGFGSRREIENWIKLKRLKVNGQIVQLGSKISGTEDVTLDNKVLSFKTPNMIDCSFFNNNISHSNGNNNDKFNINKAKIILYHKPIGKICTRSDPVHRPTVFDDLPQLKFKRWVSVGRLDVNTSGLLLFTQDGELANKLMHPSYNQEREYLVRAFGTVTPEMFDFLTKGVELDDNIIAKFKKIEFMHQEIFNKHSNNWYRVILTSGKNRVVRKLFASQGLLVNKLIRIRFGNIILPQDLKPGNFKYLDDNEKFFI